jgi:hypothetical protein
MDWFPVLIDFPVRNPYPDQNSLSLFRISFCRNMGGSANSGPTMWYYFALPGRDNSKASEG